MKKMSFAVILLMIMSMSSCRLVGDIFKAGVGVGVFLVLAVVALIIFVISKASGGGKG